MDILSVRLLARQLQDIHRRADSARFFFQMFCVAAVNAAALLLGVLSDRVRLAAAAGLCALNFGVLLVFASSNTRRFFARGCGVDKAELRPLRKQAAFQTVLFLLKLLLLAVFLLPAGGMASLSYALLLRGVTRRMLLLLLCGTAMMTALSLLFFAKAASLLFLAPYAYAGGSGMKQSMHQSIGMMTAYRRAVRRFRQSFFGWALLCAFALPIPFVFIYYRQSAAVLARVLLFGWPGGGEDDQPTRLLDKWAET